MLLFWSGNIEYVLWIINGQYILSKCLRRRWNSWEKGKVSAVSSGVSAQGNLQIWSELSNQFYALVIISGFDRHQTPPDVCSLQGHDTVWPNLQRVRERERLSLSWRGEAAVIMVFVLRSNNENLTYKNFL